MGFLSGLRRRFGGLARLGHFRGVGHTWGHAVIKPYSAYENVHSYAKAFVTSVVGDTVFFRMYSGQNGHMSKREFAEQYRRIKKGG